MGSSSPKKQLTKLYEIVATGIAEGGMMRAPQPPEGWTHDADAWAELDRLKERMGQNDEPCEPFKSDNVEAIALDKFLETPLPPRERCWRRGCPEQAW